MTDCGPIIATIWQETKKRNPVCLVSSDMDPTALVTTVQRKQKDGSKKVVPSPLVVALYNKHINGVLQSDQTRTIYSTARRSRKWWTHLFWFLIDICISNVNILFNESPNYQLLTKTGAPRKQTCWS